MMHSSHLLIIVIVLTYENNKSLAFTLKKSSIKYEKYALHDKRKHSTGSDSIKSISSKKLKDELLKYRSILGVDSTGITDRRDLEKYVLLGRKQWYDLQQQKQQQQQRQKLHQAELINYEIQRIQETLSFKEVLHELKRRNIEINPLEETKTIITYLALARLDMIDSTMTSSSSSSTGDKTIFKNNINEIISNIFDVDTDLEELQRRKKHNEKRHHQHYHKEEEVIVTGITTNDMLSNQQLQSSQHRKIINNKNQEVVYEIEEFGNDNNNNNNNNNSNSIINEGLNENNREVISGMNNTIYHDNNQSDFDSILRYDDDDEKVEKEEVFDKTINRKKPSVTFTPSSSFKKKQLKDKKLQYANVNSIQFASELIMKSMFGPLILTIQSILKPYVAPLQKVDTSYLNIFYLLQDGVIKFLNELSYWSLYDDPPNSTTPSSVNKNDNNSENQDIHVHVDSDNVKSSFSTTTTTTTNTGDKNSQPTTTTTTSSHMESRQRQIKLLLFLITTTCVLFRKGFLWYILSFFVIRTLRMGLYLTIGKKL